MTFDTKYRRFVFGKTVKVMRRGEALRPGGDLFPKEGSCVALITDAMR